MTNKRGDQPDEPFATRCRVLVINGDLHIEMAEMLIQRAQAGNAALASKGDAVMGYQLIFVAAIVVGRGARLPQPRMRDAYHLAVARIAAVFSRASAMCKGFVTGLPLRIPTRSPMLRPLCSSRSADVGVVATPPAVTVALCWRWKQQEPCQPNFRQSPR